MANQWLRLWHDMPTDPKWRTIARASGQRIGDVMAVYLHLMVCGSTNETERGRTTSFNAEDVASALDLETEQVTAIAAAMQGRVLDGDTLTGWEKRQVQREDGSAERAKAWREAKKQADERTTNAGERNRTPDKDKDTDTEKKIGKRASARTRLPEDFSPNPAGIESAKGLDLDRELTQFKDHHAAKGTVMADWQAAFRTWTANARRFAKTTPQSIGSVTVPGRQERDPALVKIEQDAKRAAPPSIETLERLAQLRKGVTA